MILRGEYLQLGNAKQWINYNAENASKPLILFLHGGPGFVMTPLLPHYCKPIYDRYLVVQWDQRGSGKSYDFWGNHPLSVQQLLADGLELVQFLCKKFQKERIILMGHSWGSALGALMCQSNPHLFYQYIGIGQIGNWLEGERVSYRFVLEKARLKGQKNLAQKLEQIGIPPYKNIADLTLQRKALLRMSGSFYNRTNYFFMLPLYLKSKAYTFFDLLKIGLGLHYSLLHLWDDVLKIDLNKTAIAWDIPVCFISGRHDFQVPSSTSKAYFDCLNAPRKTWYWFEESAHFPMFEESVKFNSLLLKEISNDE